jgi:hypothetical protein
MSQRDPEHRVWCSWPLKYLLPSRSCVPSQSICARVCVVFVTAPHAWNSLHPRPDGVPFFLGHGVFGSLLRASSRCQSFENHELNNIDPEPGPRYQTKSIFSFLFFRSNDLDLSYP